MSQIYSQLGGFIIFSDFQADKVEDKNNFRPSRTAVTNYFALFFSRVIYLWFSFYTANGLFSLFFVLFDT